MMITFYDVNINSDMSEIFHLTTTRDGNNNDGEVPIKVCVWELF